MAEIQIVAAGKLGEQLPETVLRSLPLYNQPDFLELVAPGNAFFARISNKEGKIAWFPFTGQNWFLTWRIFQVPYCQKFYPFSLEGLPDTEHWAVWWDFLRTKTVQMHWSCGLLDLPSGPVPFSTDSKINQVLPLQEPFDQLLKQWKPGRRSALRKSEACSVSYLDREAFRKALDQITAQPNPKGWAPTAKEKKAILRISDSHPFSGNVSRVAVAMGEEVLSLILLLEWQGRIHYLFSVSSQKGFAHDALTRFFFDLLEKKAASPAVFDFEGSSLPGVYSFFKSLGASEEFYSVYRKK